ncbi:MAG: class I SAM-dependent methyltransferase [Candidatus Odinarchaeia archaeon]
MPSKIPLLKALIRHPRLFKQLVRNIKDSRKYAVALVSEVFAPVLNLAFERKGVIMEEEIFNYFDIENKELYEELIGVLEKDNVIHRQGGKITVTNKIPSNVLENTEKKLSPEIVRSFKTFVPYVKKIIPARLKGEPPKEFDADELRIHWNIALKGEFYRFQRRKAYNFVKLHKLVKKFNTKTVRVLDFACGSGDSSIQLYEELSKTGVDFDMDACDISSGLLELAKEDDAVGYPISFFDLKKREPEKNEYHLIFLSQTLHWPPDPTALLGKLKTYLKEDGRLFGVQTIISEKMYYIDLFIRILGAQGFPTEEKLRSWFEANNLKLEFDPVFYSFQAYRI